MGARKGPGHKGPRALVGVRWGLVGVLDNHIMTTNIFTLAQQNARRLWIKRTQVDLIMAC